MAPYSRRSSGSTDFFDDFDDLSFKPQFRRGKNSGGKARPESFFQQVQRIAKQHSKSGPRRRLRSSRGGYVREPGKYFQRVVIKTRIVRNKIRTRSSLDKHIYYLQRESVGLDGGTPEAFNSSGTLSAPEVLKWASVCEKDRHHFRFIVSPEKGSELDLKIYAQRLVLKMEKDLDTKLSWVGVTHHNTDNPHVHILVRGKTKDRQDLVIDRDYISRGMRARGREIATAELGFRSELEVAQEQQRSITQARVVGLDRELDRAAQLSASGQVDLGAIPSNGESTSPEPKDLLAGRLNFLQSLGLAHEVKVDVWKLDENFIEKLHQLSIKNDIIKSMHRRFQGKHPQAEVTIIEPEANPNVSIQGKVLEIGLADELHDSRYLVLEAKDKKIYYLSLNNPNVKDRTNLENGQEVKLSMRDKRLRVEKVALDKGLDLGLELEIKL